MESVRVVSEEEENNNNNNNHHTLSIHDIDNMWNWMQKNIGKPDADRLQLATDIMHIIRMYAMWAAFMLTTVPIDVYERMPIEKLRLVRDDLLEFLRGVLAQNGKFGFSDKKREEAVPRPGVS